MVDKWSVGAGPPVQLPGCNFPLSKRTQALPSETSIGVRLKWLYAPPDGFGAPTVTYEHYAVFRELMVS